jgi:hypothetical protein
LTINGNFVKKLLIFVVGPTRRFILVSLKKKKDNCKPNDDLTGVVNYVVDIIELRKILSITGVVNYVVDIIELRKIFILEILNNSRFIIC